LWFIAPSVAIAIGAGVVYGPLGRWWGESRSIVAGVAIALPFIVEPVAWRVYIGFSQGPLVLPLLEVAVGIAIFSWVIAARWHLGSNDSLRKSRNPARS
jgi:ABC-type dipeptide/oligopeptide/nickel transport system permease subunit